MRERDDRPVPVPASVGPGTVLSERFRLVEPIGSGGMAIVWHAKHLGTGMPVAIKMLRAVDAHSSVARARFEKEARAIAALRHPNVVHIIELGVHAELPYIAMELLEGETLAKRLDREKKLDAQTLVWIVEQIARPIDKAHAMGIVHRDIKPANIFLAEVEGGERVKLLDFGIAKLMDSAADDTVTRTGAIIGTSHYLSPERARGKKPIDGRVDLWALAVVVYECLVARRPFDEHADDLLGLLKAIAEADYPPPSTVGTTPPEFDAWADQALNPNPNLRFDTAAQLAAALREALLPGTEPSTTGMVLGSDSEEITELWEEEDELAAPVVLTDSLDLEMPPHANGYSPAFPSEPQLRRFDMSVDATEVTLAASNHATDFVEVDISLPMTQVSALQSAEPTRVDVADPDTDLLTSAVGEALTVERRPVRRARRRGRRKPDWRLLALAAVSLVIASAVGVSLVRLTRPERSTRSQVADSAAGAESAGRPAIAVPSTPTIAATSLPPVSSAGAPVVDVEGLPVPTASTPSKPPPPSRPPREKTGAGTKPHDVFGL